MLCVVFDVFSHKNCLNWMHYSVATIRYVGTPPYDDEHTGGLVGRIRIAVLEVNTVGNSGLGYRSMGLASQLGRLGSGRWRVAMARRRW